MTKYLLPFAMLAGFGIAWIDARPNWDDSGIIAFTMLIVAGVFALVEPRRPWLWALAVGAWIPLHGILATNNWTMLVVLAFPFVGAYGGMGIRKLAAGATKPG